MTYLAKEAATKQKVLKIEKEVQNSPTNAKDFLKLGVGYYEVNKYKESITALKKSLDLEPNIPRGALPVGSCIFGQ